MNLSYDQRLLFVQSLLYKEQINNPFQLPDITGKLATTFTVGYQVNEKPKWICFLLRNVVKDNLLMCKIINLYRQWGHKYQDQLGVRNESGT